MCPLITYGKTEKNKYDDIKLTQRPLIILNNGQTGILTDIVMYRAAFKAKHIKYDP